MNEISISKIIPNLGQRITRPPKILHKLAILKPMDNRPGNHDIINIMEEPVKLSVKAAFAGFGDRVDVGSEVLDVEGAEAAVGEVEDGVAVDVEDLGWVAGGVDAFVVATVDAAAHPED